MLRDKLRRAVEDGTITFEQASDLLARSRRHAGGRPKGVTNSGPDKLERAIMALSEQRSLMPPEELEASEYRMNAMLTKRWRWNNRQVLREVRRRGALSEELAVVLAYKRSEDRLGMSRLVRVKGTLQGLGAGPVAKVVDDAETVKEASGRVRKSRRSTPGRRRYYGYKVVAEAFVEKSLSDSQEPMMLWGQDVTDAVQQELGFEPIRRRGNGRRWLAPVELTQEHVVHRGDGTEVVWLGAGSGANGLTLDNAGIVPDATLGELRQSELWRDRVNGGLPYEPDGRYVRYVTRPARFELRCLHRRELREIGVDCLKDGGTRLISIEAACIRPDSDLDSLWPAPIQAKTPKGLLIKASRHCPPVHKEHVLRGVWRPYGDWSAWGDKSSRCLLRPSVPVQPLPRCDGELTPLGMTPVEVVAFVNEMSCLQRWRDAGCPLPIVSPPNGRVDFLARPLQRIELQDGTVKYKPRPRQVYHTTTRSILTPYIKSAVLAVYGRPLPRSPLLPR